MGIAIQSSRRPPQEFGPKQVEHAQVNPYESPALEARVEQIADGLRVYVKNEPDLSNAYNICEGMFRSDHEQAIKRIELNYLGVRFEVVPTTTLEGMSSAFTRLFIEEGNIVDCRKHGWELGWDSAFRLEALSKITGEPLIYSFNGFHSCEEFMPGDSAETLARRYIRHSLSA